MSSPLLASEPWISRAAIEARAMLSRGTSSDGIYQMIAENLAIIDQRGGTLLDVGCGSGALRAYVASLYNRYVGADLVHYDSFPTDCEFHTVDLNSGRFPLPDSFADVVVAAEVVEHLENPRAFVRALVRIVKPGGSVLVTTPNQLSLLSLLTLALKQRFAAFQDEHYPAHLTALLEIDLLRIATETGLEKVTIRYSHCGRIPKSPWHYPRTLSRLWPRAFSDNVLMMGRKPAGRSV